MQDQLLEPTPVGPLLSNPAVASQNADNFELVNLEDFLLNGELTNRHLDAERLRAHIQNKTAVKLIIKNLVLTEYDLVYLLSLIPYSHVILAAEFDNLFIKIVEHTFNKLSREQQEWLRTLPADKQQETENKIRVLQFYLSVVQRNRLIALSIDYFDAYILQAINQGNVIKHLTLAPPKTENNEFITGPVLQQISELAEDVTLELGNCGFTEQDKQLLLMFKSSYARAINNSLVIPAEEFTTYVPEIVENSVARINAGIISWEGYQRNSIFSPKETRVVQSPSITAAAKPTQTSAPPITQSTFNPDAEVFTPKLKTLTAEEVKLMNLSNQLVETLKGAISAHQTADKRNYFSLYLK